MSDKEFNHPRFKAANNIQQDLFFLAKNHYRIRKIDRITSIKLILSVHVIAMEYLQLRDILHWLMSEFYEKGVILTRPDNVTRLIVNPGSIHNFPPGKRSHQELMIHEIMDQIAIKQVYENGDYLLNFDKGTPDPQVQALLDAYAAYEEAAQNVPEEEVRG